MSRLEPGYDFTLQAALVSWVASLSIWVYLNIYYPPFDRSFDPLFGYFCGVLVYFLWTAAGKHWAYNKIIKQGPDGDWLDELDSETRYFTPSYGDNWDEVKHTAKLEKLWSGSEIGVGFVGVGLGCIWLVLVFY